MINILRLEVDKEVFSVKQKAKCDGPIIPLTFYSIVQLESNGYLIVSLAYVAFTS